MCVRWTKVPENRNSQVQNILVTYWSILSILTPAYQGAQMDHMLIYLMYKH